MSRLKSGAEFSIFVHLLMNSHLCSENVMVPRMSVELSEDKLSAMVQAGDYTSKEAVIIHALEVLLAAHPPLRINTAVELYRRGKVTLSRATEIAGLEFEAFKEQLARHNVSVQFDTPPTEVRTGAEVIRHLREAP